MYFGNVSTNSVSNRQKLTVLLSIMLVCMNDGSISDEEVDEFLNAEIVSGGMTIGDLMDEFLKGDNEFDEFTKVYERWKKEKKAEES